MVIGSNVITVQRVSRYCLEQGAEVLPYYGVPTDEEVTLFAPEVLVLCLPMPEDFRYQMSKPYILWSEQATIALQSITTRTELQTRLQEILQA